MVWQTIPGIVGKVYQPDSFEDGKKHPCGDCRRCQHCSRERCQVCRSAKPAGIHKKYRTSSKEV